MIALVGVVRCRWNTYRYFFRTFLPNVTAASTIHIVSFSLFYLNIDDISMEIISLVPHVPVPVSPDVLSNKGWKWCILQ